MGMCLEQIAFMLLDNTKIEVISATNLKDFDLKCMNDFTNKKGGFSRDIDKNNHCFFEYVSGDFIEFNVS